MLDTRQASMKYLRQVTPPSIETGKVALFEAAVLSQPGLTVFIKSVREREMRKGIIFLLIILIAPASAAAAGVGLKGGLNFNRWYGSDYSEDMESVSNIMIGASFSIAAGYISVNPEIYYAVKGWKDTETLPPYYPYFGAEVTTTISMNYIEIPVLFKYSYDTGTGFKPGVYAGPYMAFILNSPELEWESGQHSQDYKLTGDCFKSRDFGLVFGGGIDFSYWIGTISLEARYNLGLTSVVAEGSKCASMNSVFLKNNKNRTFSVLAGVSF